MNREADIFVDRIERRLLSIERKIIANLIIVFFLVSGIVAFAFSGIYYFVDVLKFSKFAAFAIIGLVSLIASFILYIIMKGGKNGTEN